MAEIVRDALEFLADPSTYSGRFALQNLLLQHIWFSVAATAAALAIALPLGLWVGHRGKGELLVVQITNTGRALPDFGVMLLVFTLVGLGFVPIFVALTALAIPPVLINAYVGVGQVDPEVRDAAYGSGMTGWQVLRHVEVPIALPLIMTGVRTAVVQVVATATLAGAIGGGGFGRLIFDGLAIRNYERVLVASVAVALLALAAEYGLGGLERRLTPPGVGSRAHDPAGAGASKL
jgi:osmoprotectant transport system permease protein